LNAVLFQSLLYWISHCGSLPRGARMLSMIVSILVVLD